jgi:SAM-dependent methyltransferase
VKPYPRDDRANMNATPYDTTFYDVFQEGALRSAERVVPIVADLLRPNSVVDVGCGIGWWLSVFAQHGAPDVLGIDGDYVDRGRLRIAAERFMPADLSRPLRLDRRFDLAISLEVAEHLPPERAPGFVGDLVALAPAVLFSAALPNQGGVDHLNERWLPFWAEEFARHGYAPLDVVRPRVWDDPAVEFWYAQNTLLYIDQELHASLGVDPPGWPLSLVHPRQLDSLAEKALSPRFLLGKLPGAVRAALARRAGR